MKTTYVSATNTISNHLSATRWLLCIIGVVTAVVCSLILINEFKHNTASIDTTINVSSIVKDITKNTTSSVSISGLDF